MGSRPSSSGCSKPAASLYRPRHPERTALYRLLEDGYEGYVRVNPDRYETRWGPLREVVDRDVHAYLACGRLLGGFARIRCPRCHAEHLLAFSCRTRNLCSSCQAKRSAVFAEWVTERVLFDVAHRHVVFTVPKALRGLIERERWLHGEMAKAARDTLSKLLAEAAVEPGGFPGAVVSLQTFGSFGANFHPHLHVLVTDGVFTPDGRFHPVVWPEEAALEERFRRRFLERLARYLTRVVLAVGAVELLEGGRVRVETAPDPRMPFFLWIRFITAQHLMALHRRHIGVQMRDVRRQVSLGRGAFPSATSVALADRLAAAGTTPTQAAVQRELRVQLEEALDEMNPADREVRVLRHFEELTNGEAAAEPGIEKPAASKRYLRTLRRLGEILESCGLPPGATAP